MLKFRDGLPSDIRLGETKVKAIYFNETLVYPSTPIVTPYLEYTTVQNPDTWVKVDYTGKTEIPNEAYRENNNLYKVKIPEGVVSVGRGAFYQCANLVSVELPTTVTMIGGSAFEDCGLKSVDLTYVDHLGESVFSNCNYLTSVTFGNKLTDIPLMCFQSCPIQTLTLQEGLQTIGQGAFWVPLDMNPELYPDFATRFTEVTIPSTVTSIGISSDRSTAFYSIPKVQKIYVNKPSGSLAGAPWGAESVEWIG